MRVLIVDDEPVIRLFLVETLEQDGFEVLEASSGVEACQLMKDPDHVELVVTDLNMPGGDGVEVAKCARKFDADVPVLFISGRADLMAELPIPRPYSLLRKPFHMDQLSEAVTRLVNRQSPLGLGEGAA
jgi:DNA-binding response OmpR family regulator